MTGYVYCRDHGFTTSECSLCPSSADVHARTTVGAAFVEPLPFDEKLVKQVAAFLVGKVRPRADHATSDAAAEDYARNLVQSLILDFDIKPRGRK